MTTSVATSRRRWLTAALLVTLGGCVGGVRPTPFTSDIRPQAEALSKALGIRDKVQVLKIVEVAKKRKEGGRMSADEFAIFQEVGRFMEKDEWEPALDLVTKCLSHK